MPPPIALLGGTLQLEPSDGVTIMPYRRGGFVLTPPSMLLFVISLVLALLAMLIRYLHAPVPIISGSHVFDVLAIGVLFRGA